MIQTPLTSVAWAEATNNIPMQQKSSIRRFRAVFIILPIDNRLYQKFFRETLDANQMTQRKADASSVSWVSKGGYQKFRCAFGSSAYVSPAGWDFDP